MRTLLKILLIPIFILGIVLNYNEHNYFWVAYDIIILGLLIFSLDLLTKETK